MDFDHVVRGALLAGAISAAALGGAGCADPEPTPQLKGQVHLTLIHTSDIHSRLFPYNLQLGQVDAGLGLGSAGSIVNVGGAARVSHIIGRERARADRVLHLDGGDCFQGAPIFNFFAGEAEVRVESAMGTDAMIVANHEFDRGAQNLGLQLQRWAAFPVLAANYALEDPSLPGASPLGSIIKPYTVFDVKGLKVAVIGMGNLSSLTSIFDRPNRLGITPLNTTEVAQFYVDLVRPSVDVVVLVTHLGLEVDERMIETTTGIDVVLGGHNHIVLQPPKRVQDCSAYSETAKDGTVKNFILLDGPDAGEGALGCTSDDECGENGYCHDTGPDNPRVCKIKRYCTPRDVVLAHSGAFAKYVGRLDLVLSNDKADLRKDYDPLNGFEVLTSSFELFPVTENVPEDPIVSSLLEPYHQGLDSLANLDLLVGYALDGSKRNSTSGGDSPLGNLISTAMWLRLGIQTDFSLTNSTGIRADLVPGPVTVEQMYNIFPFDNSITKMQLSGVEVQDLFDFVARRSSGRGCVSQVQIAGARIVIDCTKEDTYTPPKCQSDADCALGKNPLGVAQVCDAATKTCLCHKDTQCPDAKPGLCDAPTGICSKGLGPGKATNIYIGTYQPAIACDSDQKCPGKGNGQCDIEAGVCWQPIENIASYELATSNYLAAGGSGFRVLQRNTTQNDTKVQQRDALIDYIRAGAPCGADPDTGALKACSKDSDCGSVGEGYACACPEATIEGDFCATDGTKTCGGKGACILAKCRDDVAAFQRQTCEGAPSKVKEACEKSLGACAAGGEQCKFLACVDRGLGNFSDGRVKMVGQ
ncbi:MAG: 5'-nucleotidase C-terminal domain-containing protein [Minicystis sp.]